MSDRYKCPNCGTEWIGEHEGHDNPLCSNCSVERMVELVHEPCQECGEYDFHIYAPKSMCGSVTAECQNCGTTPDVDESGMWWTE